jgi:D-glycero-D-manno-heptose 1,7-bisphosphate phosphatase
MEGRTLFLDRDGVVNREVGYLFRKEDVHFVSGIFSLCRTAKKLGYRLVVVGNQPGIARGIFTEADYAALMKWMREEFRREEIVLDGIFHTPHPPAHGTHQPKHEDRNQGTGLLRRAAHDLHLALAESVMVGDRCADMAMANANGLRQAFLLRGTEEGPCGGAYVAVDSLAEVEAWLLAQEQTAGAAKAG